MQIFHTKQEKIQKIEGILDELYPDPEVPLRHGDAFTLLVAVVLSAQCTDQRVNEITPILFERAPTAEAMAQRRYEEVYTWIKRCGMGQKKSRYLVDLSKILVSKYGGQVPEDIEALESLPGVGHKTASVVMSQAFGHNTFPVDTHIHRLAARWGLSNGRNVRQTERDLKQCFAPETWRKRHIQMIRFGREYCPARGHDIQKCPICSWAYVL